jgi:putative ABC transport system permease protein
MRLLPFDYAVRNLGRSRWRLALSLVGSALVAGLALTAGAFVSGMNVALRATGGEHNVIVLGAGSEDSVERSEIDPAAAGILAASVPGLRSRAGSAYVSPETHVQLPLRTRTDAPKGPLALVRGVTPAALLTHADVQIVEGRLPESGADEVMVGAMLATRLGVGAGDVEIGRTLFIDDRQWRIVGRFVAPGTVLEAEVWAPLQDLKGAMQRTTDSCVVVTLDPASAEFADVDAFTKTRLDLELVAMHETDYYTRLAAFYAPIRAVAWATAGLIGLGGLFGGLNLTYAAFVSRVREIGALRSLGFRSGAIALSLVQEATLATTAGSLLACALGALLLDGVSVRFSSGVFGLVVDAPVILIALGAGLALGLVGALPPAARCLRMPIPAALKAM